MPRRLGAIVYNKSNGLLELVDSADINGRIWYEYDPETYPWMMIGNYKPDGQVHFEEYGVDPMICFRESSSGNLAFLEFDYGGWIDSSPDNVACAPGPVMVTSSAPLGLPVMRVFYITPQRDELRAIERDIYGTWQVDDTELVVAAEPGSEITEFALFTSGQTSYESYLVYNIGGELIAMRCTSTSFNGWTEQQVLDDAGTCRDLRIVKVGTGETWDSHHYASYIKDGEGDTKLICFRDLYEATRFD